MAPARPPVAAQGSRVPNPQALPLLPTEKHPEEEDEVACVLLSASKILNSSEGVKENGGSEKGKTFQVKARMAVKFLPFTTGSQYIA